MQNEQRSKPTFTFSLSDEAHTEKSQYDIPLYWLVNSDSYNGLL